MVGWIHEHGVGEIDANIYCDDTRQDLTRHWVSIS